MTTTFQKRQKEMKRLDKARAKQERRAQRKLEKRAEKDNPTPDTSMDADIAPPEVDGGEPQGGTA
jgi:hypothetical protein